MFCFCGSRAKSWPETRFCQRIWGLRTGASICFKICCLWGIGNLKDQILTNSNSWGCTTQVFLHSQVFRQSFSHQTKSEFGNPDSPSSYMVQNCNKNESLQQLVKLHLHSNMAKNEFSPIYTNSKKPQFLGIRSFCLVFFVVFCVVCSLHFQQLMWFFLIEKISKTSMAFRNWASERQLHSPTPRRRTWAFSACWFRGTTGVMVYGNQRWFMVLYWCFMVICGDLWFMILCIWWFTVNYGALWWFI